MSLASLMQPSWQAGLAAVECECSGQTRPCPAGKPRMSGSSQAQPGGGRVVATKESVFLITKAMLCYMFVTKTTYFYSQKLCYVFNQDYVFVFQTAYQTRL